MRTTCCESRDAGAYACRECGTACCRSCAIEIDVDLYCRWCAMSVAAARPR